MEKGSFDFNLNDGFPESIFSWKNKVVIKLIFDLLTQSPSLNKNDFFNSFKNLISFLSETSRCEIYKAH